MEGSWVPGRAPASAQGHVARKGPQRPDPEIFPCAAAEGFRPVSRVISAGCAWLGSARRVLDSIRGFLTLTSSLVLTGWKELQKKKKKEKKGVDFFQGFNTVQSY